VKIKHVCSSPEEAVLLHAAISDFSDRGARSRYADRLAANGDAGRADSVRATIEAYQTLKADGLVDLAGNPDWQKMIAIPLSKVFISNSEFYPANRLNSFRDLLFARLRPAVSLKYALMDGEPAIGTSRLWGLPDLQVDQAWPRIAEASNVFSAREKLPLEDHCAFIEQFSFRDFKDTLFGQDLPANGGFSIFSITDLNIGVVETLVRPWDNTQPLSRRAAPPELIADKIGEQVNSPSPPHEIELTECLSLPDASSGVFAAEIPLCGWGEAFYDAYPGLLEQCNGHVMGFGGYLKGTSGDDPSPDTDARRFAVLRTNPDAGLVHFSIPSDDVGQGRLGRVQYVWNDWDG